MKLTRTSGIILCVTLWVLGCIREDVTLPPVLETLTKSSFTAGSIITLNGNHLGRSARVFINDSIVSVQGEPTQTEIQFIVPFVRSKTETALYVSTQAGSSVSQAVTILPPLPLIKKVIPNRASVGKSIKIYGSYFHELALVQFSSGGNSWIDATAVKIGDTLKVTVPDGLSRDAADIRIRTESGESESASFFVLVAPEISGVSHLKGGPGMIITLSGKNFENTERVLFGNLAAEIISNTPDKLLVRIPEEATTDNLTVETEGGSDTYSEKFIIIPKPEITGLDKQSGRHDMDVNITGNYFSDVSDVRFGNAPAEFEIQSSNTIKTKIPSAAGSGKIYITGPGGTIESDKDFIIEGAPLISDFEPKSGSTGTEVLLTGLNLSGATKAYLGASELDVIQVQGTDTQLKVKIGTNPFAGKISVVTPGGTSETKTNFNIPGGVEIITVSPLAGLPGTIVTIVGKNLPQSPIVKFFDGVVATTSSSTPTQIICQVPANAKDGKINVNGAFSPESFKVIVSPTIASIHPMQGAVGKDITITGSGLAGVTLKFNNTNATPTTAGNEKLIVKVPAGATTGKISITSTGGEIIYSDDNFSIIFPPENISFSPRSGAPGTIVTIEGTNLHHNPDVQFFSQVTATIKSISATRLLVEVPKLASGNERITIKTDAVNNFVATNEKFAVVGKPDIKSISPLAGTIKEFIKITGSNFENLVSVNFDGISAEISPGATKDQVLVQVPTGLNATTNRTINLNVQTSSDVSAAYPFKLLGTPTITKLSPDNNPAGWAFLITGTNLNNVRRLSLNDEVPQVGSNGIDQQAFNYITTKVPIDLTPPTNQNMTLKLHYTIDGSGFTPKEFEVLSAPPLGVFPPPQIILPPPLPPSYVQTDLSDYWINVNFPSPTPDSVLVCYQLRANFAGEPEAGNFCQINKFDAHIKPDGTWGDQTNSMSGSGTWNHGLIEINFYNDSNAKLTGRVYDKTSQKLVLEDIEGRQLILIHDKNKRCQSSNFDSPGPCSN